MADVETIEADSPGSASAHPTTGGKSLLAYTTRPAYKSFRKKYRKIRYEYDAKADTNRRLFRGELRLEAVARRLREEVDAVRELCLEVNSSPVVPPHLRFGGISAPGNRGGGVEVADIAVEEADELLRRYAEQPVKPGNHSHAELHNIRDQVDMALARQEVEMLASLEKEVPRLVSPGNSDGGPERGEEWGYLTPEQENVYLELAIAQLDERGEISRQNRKFVGGEERWQNLGYYAAQLKKRQHSYEDDENDDELAIRMPRIGADPTALRDLDRQMELRNPQSQHRWLKRQQSGTTGADGDEVESLTPHHGPRARTSGKRKTGKKLARQMGERAVERAREFSGGSPGATSVGGDEEDWLAYEVGAAASKKKGKDVDGTYRLKGGKSGGGGRGKRKRTGEDVPAGSGKKKAKLEDGGEGM